MSRFNLFDLTDILERSGRFVGGCQVFLEVDGNRKEIYSVATEKDSTGQDVIVLKSK